ncbi:MAG: non-ribosomal peptide synthase/polyketide synthase [Halanaerobiales bacterium]|nr:non-ribosomal peptide synthase/polyketide synthase [Halanaerobiales bacterium]
MLAKIFNDQVKKYPEKLAVKTNSKQLTYLELNQSANLVGHEILDKLKVSQNNDHTIALLFEHGIDMIIGTIGAIKTKTKYVPLDPDYPFARLKYILLDAKISVIVTNDKNINLAEKLIMEISKIQLINIKKIENKGNYNDLELEIGKDQPAYILYTSGSTGNPKGVIQNYENLLYHVENYRKTFSINSNDKLTLFSKFTHDAALMDIYAGLLHGATIYPFEIKKGENLIRLAQWLRREQITIYHSVPSLYRYFIKTLIDDQKFPDLRWIILGGEEVIEHDIQIFKKYFNNLTVLANLYGQTESSFNSCQLIETDTPFNQVTLGEPIKETELFVVSESGEEVSTFEIGEIYVISKYVALGYLNDIEKTEKSFGNHPEMGRFYKTGDLGRLLADDTIQFVGRKDKQIKIRGLRVELGEIESRLLEYPDLTEGVVILKQDEEGEAFLVAWVVVENDLSEKDLRSHLQLSLPDYMIPGNFIELEQLPTTSTGKIDRKALEERELEFENKVEEYQPPADEVESGLIKLLLEIISQPKIGINEDFFKLGVHSLRAMTLISKIYQKFNVKLSIKDIFNNPTVKELASVIKKTTTTSFVSIEKVERLKYYPLSSAQKRLYIINRLNPESTAYNMPKVLSVKGTFDLQLFEKAINKLVLRHGALRTYFDLEDETPVQKIAEQVDIEILKEQASSEKEVKKIMKSWVLPFDLNKASLFKVGLIEFGTQYYLFFDLHHIIADGTSMGILINDFIQIYQGQHLEKLKIQYKDFAIWQNSLLESEEMREQENYWLGKFSGEVPVLELPTDFSRSLEITGDSLTISFELNPKLTSKINKLADDTGTTLFMILLSIFNILLARYSGNEDIVIGSPTAGRSHPDLKDVIGMFVNTLPLRNQPQANLSFRNLLESAKENTLKALENQDYQFEMLIEKLKLERNLNHNPLFDVLFVFQNMESTSMNILGVQFEQFEFQKREARLDLSLVGVEREDKVSLEFEYNAELYKKSTIERLAKHFINIAETITTDLDIELSKIKMLSDAERERLIKDFNQTKREYPVTTLDKIFENVVSKNAKKTALLFQGQQMTYGEFNQQANKLARLLREKGVGKKIVGIIAKQSFEMFIGILGILKAGGAYLPIDPTYPEQRIEYLLEDSGIEICLYQGDLSRNFKTGQSIKFIDLNDKSNYEAYSGQNLKSDVKQTDLAYVIYTSGTTGKPKGVMIEHQNVVNMVFWRQEVYEINSNDRFVQFLSFAFDGFLASGMTPIMSGSLLVLTDKEIEPAVIKKIIIREKITYLVCVPSLYGVILEFLTFKDCSSVKRVILAGEKLPKSLVEKSKKLNPALEVINEYGPTENTVVTTVKRDLNYQDKITIGKPIGNTRVYLLDEYLNPVAVGVIGEICISGKGLARGYLKRPELTLEKFIDNPFEDGEKMYKTGDLAKWTNNGELDFVGRKDNQIKLRGYRIETKEIEAVINQHPLVKGSVVTVKEDNSHDKYLCGYYQVDDANLDVDVREIEDFLKARLPEYMIPGYLLQIGEIPLTPNGKVDYDKLPHPDGLMKLQNEYITPTNETENRLTQLFCDILGKEMVGIKDDFFLIGGHSIKATILVARVLKEFNIELPLRKIFENPTVEELARCIQNAEKKEYQPIKPVEKREFYPASSIQKRIYILEQFGENDTSYNMPSVFNIKGSINYKSLVKACQRLVERYPILRTYFEFKDGAVIQKNVDKLDFEVELLKKMSEDNLNEVITTFIRPFDLGQAPLFRVGLIEKELDNDYILILDIHHIISDGTSMEIIFDELMKLYEGKQLPESKVYYKDFAVWQQKNLLTSNKFTDQGKYWLNQFKGKLPKLNLPTDYPRPAVKSSRGDRFLFEIDKELSENLKKLAQENNVTNFMILLALYSITLGKSACQDDILIGTVLAGRNHPDIEKLLGCFLNNIVFCCQAEGEKSFEDYLSELKYIVVNGYQNQDYPIEELIDQLNLPFDMSRNPLFDVMLIFQNFERRELNLELSDFQIKPHPKETKTAKYDLTLYASEFKDQFIFTMEYSTDLFKEETIRAFFEHLVVVAKQIIKKPDQRISDLSILTELEREKILYQFNRTINQGYEKITLHQLFENSVNRNPDKVALITDDREMTYQKLNQKANQLANHLRERVLKKEEKVILMLRPSAKMMIGLLAILKAGGAYLPIDPDYPVERINYILKDSGSKILLVENKMEAGIDFTGQVIDITDSKLYQGSSKDLENINSCEDLAYIIYTSGSTGNPKGVMVEHRNVINYVNAFLEEFKLSADDIVLQQASFAFDAFVEEVYPILRQGGKLIIPKREDIKDVSRLIDLLIKHQVTILSTSPLLINELNQSERLEELNLRILISGGDVLKGKYFTNLIERMQVYNTYGPTETTVCASYYHCLEVEEDIPIGNPISNYQIYIMDRNGNLLPSGIPGEICIAGFGVSRGYLKRPELTEEKFVFDHQLQQRIYRTGDLGCWREDGLIEFHGRIDNQVQIRGYRIEPGEIEAKLLEHQLVEDVVVINGTDGSGETYLAVYAKLYDEILDDERKQNSSILLREFLKDKLPEYMIPAYFVIVDEIPVTHNGKVDRKALGDPTRNIERGLEYLVPESELERKLAQIWSEILEIEKIGVLDNFFVLGGHSLKATTLAGRVKKELNLNLPLTIIFKKPTIRELAQYLSQAQQSIYSALSTVKKKEYYPVSSAQKRMYLLNQLSENQSNYNLPYAWIIEGKVDYAKLNQSFIQLIERHESFRTSFELIEGEIVQKIDLVDFSVKFDKVKAEKLDQQVEEFIRPFDLKKAPLLRVELLEIEKDKYLLMLDMHHIISDGYSIDLLINEFLKLYEGYSLSKLQIQYKDFAEWQNKLFETSQFKKQEEYWLNRFSPDIPVLELPTDFKRPKIRKFSGEKCGVKLDKNLSDSLYELAKENEATIYMILLAAYNILLSRYAGHEDIIVGSPIAGRNGHPDLSNIVGMFVNTLPMRNQPCGNKSFIAFLSEVKANALSAYENQDYPFEMLVEKLDLERDMSHNPLFDIVFAMQNTIHTAKVEHSLKVSPYYYTDKIARFDLTMFAYESINGLYFEVEYSTELYRAETIKRLTDHFKQILLKITAKPEIFLQDIDLLNEVEKRKILEFNNSMVEYPQEKTIGVLFEEQVYRTPDKIALVSEVEQLTYLKLNQKANRLAHILREKGVDRESIVAVMMERSLDAVVTILAIVQAGGAYLPIDLNYPPKRISYLLKDAKIKLLLSNVRMMDIEFSGEILNPVDYIKDDFLSSFEFNLINKPGDLIYIIYTSGSTGKPKGVMIEHRNVNALLASSMSPEIKENDRVLQTATIAFDASIFEIWGTILKGASLYIISKEKLLMPKLLEEKIKEYNITFLWLTTALFHQLAEENPTIFASLKTLIFGGEVVSIKYVNLIRKMYPKLTMLNMYGPTENTTFSTAFKIEKTFNDNVPIGKPTTNTKVYIIDKYNNLQPIGLPGELCTAGEGVGRGYLNQPELTNQKFVEDPLEAGKKMYRTGDIASWLADGNLEFVGRVDNQVKIRGFRVEPGEIENQILTEPEIKECVVIVKEIKGSKTICVFIKLGIKKEKEEFDLFVKDVKVRLSNKFPDYMIPTYFIQVDLMPLTLSGKIDRKSLPEINPDSHFSSKYQPPTNETEKKLATLFAQVLGVQQVGIKDDFFELGGHSLKATSLASKINNEFGNRITLRNIFEERTVEKLAQYLEKSKSSDYPVINKTAINDYYPVSSAQKRMYLMQQMDEESIGYNMPGAVYIKDNLDIKKLERAFRKIIDRHETLRTYFIMEDKEPVQIIANVDFQIELLEGKKDVIKEFFRPFDLRQPPLLRVGLLELEDCYLMVFDIHHIVFDGVSMGILLDELMKIYAGQKLEELKFQYKDFAVWQNKLSDSKLLKNQERYWMDKFSDEIPILNLPTDYLRPTVKTFVGDTINLSLTEKLTRQLEELTQRFDSTLYLTLLAVYNILLAKYTGQQDLLVGSPSAGRGAHQELEKLIGMFVNTIVMRNYVDDEKSFADFLKEVKLNGLEVFENQDYQFEMLVDKLEINRDLSRNPLFDTMFALQNMGYQYESQTANALELESYSVKSKISKFDLTVSAVKKNQKIEFTFEYSTDLFKQQTIEQMAKHLINILRKIVKNPEIKLAEIEMLSDKERKQLIEEFNDNQCVYTDQSLLHQLFISQAEKTPDEIAISFGDQILTYAEYNRRSNQLARLLREKGASPDKIIAVIVERSLEMAIAILAVMKAGAAYLPIDPDYPRERIQYLLRDSGASLLLTCIDISTKITDFSGEIIKLNNELFVGDSANLEIVNQPTDLAYVIYTSGTTGNPKGVMIEHHSISNALYWRKDSYNFTVNDRVLILFSFAFDGSVLTFFTPLISGAQIVLLDNQQVKEPFIIKEIVGSKKVTHISCVPSIYTWLLECFTKKDVESLKTVSMGGEQIGLNLIEKSKKLKPDLEIANEYGPTENSVISTINRNILTEFPVSIGSPVPNTKVYILDKNFKPVPVGVPGQICLGGVQLARGYLNRPDLTHDKFVNNPFISGEKMYLTGDLGRWLADEKIEFLGRIDSQIKVRGYRIELGEIENQLLTSHESITEVVVVDINDQKDNTYLVGYYSADEEISPKSIKAQLAEELPEYMIPAYLIQLDKLPVTSHGKIDRKVLPLPDIDKEKRVKEYPKDEIEKKLASIWEDILNLSNIGVNDNFFDLGGHSLKATAMMAKIYKEFGVKVSLQQIFKEPTIRGIRVYIASREVDYHKKISPIEEKRAYYPVSQTQMRMYILYQLENNAKSYNMPLGVFLMGKLDIERLKWAFKQLIERHESLRTSFEVINDEPIQKIHDEVDFKIIYSSMKENELDSRLKSFIRPFNFKRPPLFRVELIEIIDKTDSCLLLCDFHHIIMDGVSMRIFINELIRAYNGDELPQLKLQYKDYAVWKRKFLESEEMAKQEKYWLGQFADEIPVLNLPIDYSRPLEKNFAGAVYQFSLDEELADSLNQLAKEKEATLYIILLTAYSILLARYSGQSDINIGSPIAGRTDADLENIIGMFVNTVVMRIRPDIEKTIARLLTENKETALEAFSNQDYPFDLLVEKLNITRDLSKNPLFDTMFALQNIDEGEVKRGELKFIPYHPERKTAKFDLFMDAYESNSKIKIDLEYSTQLFKAETIKRMATHFEKIVIEMIKNPHQKISDLEMITEDEKKVILNQFNDTSVEYPKMKTIHQLFQEQVKHNPQKTALYYNGEEMTYQTLQLKANGMAYLLREKGVVRERIVGLMVERSFEMIVGLLAILKAGGAYLAIDYDYPEKRIAFMLEDSNIKLLLTKSQLTKELSFDGEVIYLDQPIEERRTGPELVNHPEDLMYLIYTSGSTGRPKGVQIEHRNIVNLINFELTKTNIDFSKVLQFTTISFDVSYQEIFTTLLAGGELYLIDKEKRDDFNQLFKFIEDNNISTIFVPVSFLKFVFTEEEYLKEFPGCIKHILTAGEQLIVTEGLKKYLAKNQVYLHNHYGPSETHVVTTLTMSPNEEIWELPPIGKPIDNTRIYIVDENERLQPIGIVGELYVGGANVGRGYYQRSKLTTEKFVEDICHPAERMYKTGDLARWLVDGTIEFEGRKDHQVKIRGFRIELEEIEEQLLKIKEIKEITVVDFEDENKNKYLVAYLVVDQADELSIAKIKTELGNYLPDYMIPSYFVILDKIPINANGKIDRKALPEPDGVKQSETEYRPPETELEKRLVILWSQVLKVDQVGIDNNFFALGGHSLRATLLTAKINKEFNTQISLREIFKRPTIASLAQYLESIEKRTYQAIEKIERRDFYPLSSAQQRLFIIEYMTELNINYNLPCMFRLVGELDYQQFKQSLQKLIDRHEAFRTFFELIDGEPVQRIEDELVVDLKLIELNDKDKLEKIISDYIRPFDLFAGPLFRVGLIKLEKNQHIFIFDMHHIIADGTSLEIISSDFARLYQNEPLQDLRIQYKDFAVWQVGTPGLPKLENEAEYWLDQFAGEIPVLDLPTDKPRPALMSHHGAGFEFSIDEELTGQLKRLAAQNNTTLYMLLLAVYNVLLVKYSGQEDIIVGTPVAGRNHADLEGIVGMFVNTLAIRSQPGGKKVFKNFLNEVKNICLSAFENQNYQFEMLINNLELVRDVSRNPLFDVMFALQNTEKKTIVLEDIEIKPYSFDNMVSKFDLTLNAIEVGEGIGFGMVYRTDLFEAETICRMSQHFKNLLQAVVKNPEFKIANYMVPARIQIVDKANDKIDRKALKIPERDKVQISANPMNEVETKLAEILEDVLNIDKVNVEQDFFELGGNSLLAIKTVIKAREKGLKLEVNDIFQYKNIYNLAKYLTKCFIETAVTEEKRVVKKLSSIRPGDIKVKGDTFTPENVLLTGATGYLGIHILEELLKTTKARIYCLVRGSEDRLSLDRLKQKLKFYFGNQYDCFIEERIFVIQGDLTKEYLRLSKKNYDNLANNIDTIIHTAALVKHFGDYKEFYQVNVQGTARIVELACRSKARLCYISTMSVSGSRLHEEKEVRFTENDLYIGQSFEDNVYVKSKFEAENMIVKAFDRGLDAIICRVGNLTGRLRDGLFQENLMENAFYNRLLLLTELQKVSEDMLTHVLEFTPVDCCSRAIVKLIKTKDANNQAFHLYNYRYIKLAEIVEFLRKIDYHVQIVSNEEFKKAIEDLIKENQSEAMVRILPYLMNEKGDEEDKSIIHRDAEITNVYFDQLDFGWLEVGEEYLRKIFSYLVKRK